MEPLNVVEQIRSRFIKSPIRLMSNTLPLELAEEAFASRVVATMANGTHTANQRISAQKALIVGAGKLASPVRMQKTDQLP